MLFFHLAAFLQLCMLLQCEHCGYLPDVVHVVWCVGMCHDTCDKLTGQLVQRKNSRRRPGSTTDVSHLCQDGLLSTTGRQEKTVDGRTLPPDNSRCRQQSTDLQPPFKSALNGTAAAAATIAFHHHHPCYSPLSAKTTWPKQGDSNGKAQS